jgi:hypothetical protein
MAASQAQSAGSRSRCRPKKTLGKSPRVSHPKAFADLLADYVGKLGVGKEGWYP